MTFPLTLAVISDLHIGDQARSRELCPPAIATARPDEPFLKHFIDFVASEHLTPDLLIIPGDVSAHAHPAEYSHAAGLIDNIVDALHLSRAQLILTPGNHDVDWAIQSAYPGDHTLYSRDQRYATMRHEKWYFDSLLRRGLRHLCEPPYFVVIDDPTVFAVVYNSAHEDGPQVENHPGSIDTDILLAMEAAVSETFTEPDRARLFIMHHHLFPYAEPDGKFEFSAIQRADLLQEFLENHRFDIVIHGHKHFPRLNSYEINNRHRFTVFGSGSFSAFLNDDWADTLLNQFHIITITGRNTRTQTIHGNVRSWAYTRSRSWIPSDPDKGIHHLAPFGANIEYASLRHTLQDTIAVHVRKVRYIEWESIIASHPEFESVDSRTVMQVLREIATALKLNMYGDYPQIALAVRETI